MPKSSGRKRKQREAERREHLRKEHQEIRTNQNVGEMERVVSSIFGGTLLIGGLSRRSLPGLAIAATGAAFLCRGATGHCQMYESLGLDTNRKTLNAGRTVSQRHETAHLEDSIGEDQFPSKPRRRQRAKSMTGKKDIGKAATVSSFPKQ